MNMLIDRREQDNMALVPLEGRVCYVSTAQLEEFGNKMLGYDLKLYEEEGSITYYSETNEL